MDLMQANKIQNRIVTIITVNVDSNKETSHPDSENPNPCKSLFNYPPSMLSVKSLLAFATCLMLSVCSLRYCVTIGIWMQQALLTKSKYPHTPFSCNNSKSNVSLFCSAMFNVACSCIFSFSSVTRIALASAAICLVRLHNIL